MRLYRIFFIIIFAARTVFKDAKIFLTSGVKDVSLPCLLLLIPIGAISCRTPSEFADLFVDVRKGLLTVKLLPHILVVLHAEPEHLVEVLPVELGLCVERHKAVPVNGMTLQFLLDLCADETLDGGVPEIKQIQDT